ncbi:tripartite tricarboxylate transporter TctB family protein [Bosea sp. 117]|uniref:tripartite tricarboxylate transporter TctB family protein n=1 Tax=Bosea sp. 117 TaxID=1125973 RepID=UPI000690759A|nr:tripartite tricarboxylate transporter TctB family protein [Bosea sp. 117]
MMQDNAPLARTDRRDPTALYSGLLFIAFGIGFLVIGSGYEFGTARQMGPGYFPRVLSILLIALGAIVLLFERHAGEHKETPVSYRALLLIPLAAVVFAFSIRGAGIVPAVFVSALICSCASPELKARIVVLVAATLAVFSGAVFVKGLGLPIPLVGPWLGM